MKHCGIEKKVLYKDCILPVLLTVCENKNANIIDLISKIVEQITMISDDDANSDKNVLTALQLNQSPLKNQIPEKKPVQNL